MSFSSIRIQVRAALHLTFTQNKNLAGQDAPLPNMLFNTTTALLILTLCLPRLALARPTAKGSPHRLSKRSHKHITRHEPRVHDRTARLLVKRRPTPADGDDARPAAIVVGRKQRKRNLNDAPAGTVVHVPLKRNLPSSDLPPLQRFYAHQAHAVTRHARMLGRPVDIEALKKRGMPIAMGGKKYRPTSSKTLEKEGEGRVNAVIESSKSRSAELAVATDAVLGFSPIAAQAALANAVTEPVTPTAKNTLGLAVEGADIGYFADVLIGTPPREFKLIIDSGSADLWVPSQACRNCNPRHTKLGSTTSSSFEASNQTFAITYGTGEVDGSIIRDNLKIGDLELPAHVFGVATSESVEFSSDDTPFEGIMGTAQSILSNQGVPTPIESLADQKIVRSAQMGYRLASVVDDPNVSQVSFGGVDKTKFTGDLDLVDNVSTQGFWEAAMDDVTVDGQSLALAGRTAILDTGTTLLVVPEADADAIHAAIPGSAKGANGDYTIPCTTTSTVSLVIGGKAFNINPKDLAFLPIDIDKLDGECQSGITAGQIGGARQWLVGDVFLKGNYFATDVANNQIGLAPAK